MRVRAIHHWLAFIIWIGALPLMAETSPQSLATTASRELRTGRTLYESACAACHGTDGRGAPASLVGFDTALPDFTDCSFATPETDADWLAIVHDGGPARAFSRRMPAFGEALSGGELQQIVDHLRTFCTSHAWP